LVLWKLAFQLRYLIIYERREYHLRVGVGFACFFIELGVTGELVKPGRFTRPTSMEDLGWSVVWISLDSTSRIYYWMREQVILVNHD